MNIYFCKIVFSLTLFFYQVHSKNSKCLAIIEHKVTTFDSLEKFGDATCAQCYWILGGTKSFWKNDSIVDQNMAPIYEPIVEMCFNIKNSFECHPFKYNQLNFDNKENDLYLSQFASNYHRDFFLNCCADAKYCCEDIQSAENVGHPNNCPAEWDGWSCWHSAEPEAIEYNKCPDTFYYESEAMPSECTREYASKKCRGDGTWFANPNNDSGTIYLREFADYSNCLYSGVTLRTREAYLYIAGYSFSLLLTFIGSTIFLVYKQYKLLRIRVHLNFFLSLMLTCIFSIGYFSQINVDEPNHIACKSITVLRKSAHLANYCWMFIEGIYLHQLIATIGAVREKRHAFYYYVFGWGTAPLIMIVFITVHSMQKYDDSCWVRQHTIPDWIWQTLPLFCIIANAVLLVNVVRVLYVKLRSTPDHLKSGLRASLALIPIYGIQFLFYINYLNPYETCSTISFVLKYTQIVVESLQGAMVAFIFCFFNREVHMNIKRSIRRRFPKKDSSEMVTEEATV